MTKAFGNTTCARAIRVSKTQVRNELAIIDVPDMLTPSELAKLRRSTQEADAYLAKAFKNHGINLEVGGDTDFDTRADAPSGDALAPGVDPAAQEQPGTRRDGEAGRERAQEAGRAPREV